MPQGKREHILDYVIPLPPINIQSEIVKECEEVDSQETQALKIINDSRAKIESLFRELDSMPKTTRFNLENKRAFNLSIGKRVLNFEVPDIDSQNEIINKVIELESAIKESRLKIKSLSGHKELILKKYLA